MANPFTQESRDSRLSINLDGFIEKLRAPDSIHQLVMRAKPLHMPVSDFALKAMLDSHLITAILRSDYREVYDTLVTLFGGEVTIGTSRKPPQKAEVTNGTFGAKRHLLPGGTQG